MKIKNKISKFAAQITQKTVKKILIDKMNTKNKENTDAEVKVKLADLMAKLLVEPWANIKMRFKILHPNLWLEKKFINWIYKNVEEKNCKFKVICEEICDGAIEQIERLKFENKIEITQKECNDNQDLFGYVIVDKPKQLIIIKRFDKGFYEYVYFVREPYLDIWEDYNRIFDSLWQRKK